MKKITLALRLLTIAILSTIGTTCIAKTTRKYRNPKRIIKAIVDVKSPKKKGTYKVPTIKGVVNKSSGKTGSDIATKAANEWDFIIKNSCMAISSSDKTPTYGVNFPDGADAKFPSLVPIICTNQTQAGLFQLILNNSPEIFTYKWNSLTAAEQKNLLTLNASAGSSKTPINLIQFAEKFNPKKNILSVLQKPVKP